MSDLDGGSQLPEDAGSPADPGPRRTRWTPVDAPETGSPDAPGSPDHLQRTDPAGRADHPGPTRATDTAPAEPRARRLGRRHRPSRAAEPVSGRSRRTIVIGLLATVALIVVAGLVAYVVGVASPDPAPTPSHRAWPLALPLQVDGYSRDPNTTTTPTTKQGVTTLSATYAKDNQDAVIVLMSRPATDLRTFMTQAAMNAVADQPLSDGSGTARCGVSLDNNHISCAIIQDTTAVLVVGLLDQPRQQLADLAEKVGSTAAAG